ncbi:hypothetical protein IE81DRAFT_242160 [Ceraceosorus guamensis]|uniref:Uncharacterized protein n=1 Tax=Ceraceosorus guamensis TaxID=1522189 RepID=A0A316WA98_9BASI|nr:hypothetical protein IE81DRAFT_242160 [Ceraceosorus guamensis]PWN44893.1 hypothetical protein IE81DRAFT_242160 [Ceraceosorus guamensis]
MWSGAMTGLTAAALVCGPLLDHAMLRLERKYRSRTKLIFAGMGMRPRSCRPASSLMGAHQERAELNFGPRYVNHTSKCRILAAQHGR